VADAREGRVSTFQWSPETPLLEYASSISPVIFHRPRVSKRCMGNQLSKGKKILVTNMLKEEFKDIELHGGGGLNLIVIRDTQSSRKIDFHGYRGVFFLTFGFKDEKCNRLPR
jgi:hypothetical protein